MSENIFKTQESLIPVPSSFSNIVRNVADALGVQDMCVVGGAVRDCVLGKLSGHDIKPKDLDIILPSPLLDIARNPNVVKIRQNSLGGIKYEVKDFGIVDIFQYYTSNPENIIARFFDFNCNSLFYRMKTNKIIASVFFYEFLESRTISQQNMLFINNKVVGQYGVPETVMRAIKFQIQFMDKYDIKTKLGFEILHLIHNMTKQDELDMKKYMKSHVMDNKLQKMIWQKYQTIKR
jgi:hypothetical protein